MSQYSVSAAHRITGKSRTTLTKHLNEGKLSFSTDATGNKLIDASELIRVYGDDCNFEAGQVDAAPARAPAGEPGAGQGDGTLLEKEKEERRRERQQYEAQVEHLKEALEKAQDGYNRVTLLLEYHTKAPDGVQQQLIALEQRLAENEKRTQEQVELVKRRARVVVNKYRLKLEEEKKKTFWQKLTGRE